MAEYIGDHIKAVFFDLDDTLMDTIGSKWAQHKFIAQKYYQKKLTDAEIIDHWGKPLNELICLLYGTDDSEDALAKLQLHHREYPKKIYDKSSEVLKHLHDQGKTIGIITASKKFSVAEDFNKNKLPRKYIDYLQTAEDTPYHKPDPRVFEPALKWLKTHNIQSDEVIYIGDGLHDMKAALGAGFSFLGVETGLVTAQQFLDAEGKSIPSIADLL
jgi:phosphoglycolate phosphatase